SCSNLTETLSFYNASGRQQDSQKVELQLAACAPESLDYARRMAEAGRHAEAASYLAELVKANPWQRAGRRMLVQELLLSGREQQAQQEAHTLHELSPNSEMFVRWSAAPYEALDSRSDRADGFSKESQFYA